jgi:hypothetical protein
VQEYQDIPSFRNAGLTKGDGVERLTKGDGVEIMRL